MKDVVLGKEFVVFEAFDFSNVKEALESFHTMSCPSLVFGDVAFVSKSGTSIDPSCLVTLFQIGHYRLYLSCGYADQLILATPATPIALESSIPSSQKEHSAELSNRALTSSSCRH
jgi:hypothetical protein